MDSAYFPPPSAAPLPLFDVVTNAHVGWFCHAEHKPTVEIDWANVGACCLSDQSCVTTDAANCQAAGGQFQGVGVSCTEQTCAAANCPTPGDADNGGEVDIGDAIFIVKYAFEEGSPKPPFCDQADADGGGDVNIGDAIYIVRYVFVVGAPAPVCPNPGGLTCL
ncbi:MAG: hypothetical protein IIB00_03720 [candidate division Zixibacteria bacterium]|nr:hypothetical protein [candidate division Zixibacteria bacterium]